MASTTPLCVQESTCLLSVASRTRRGKMAEARKSIAEIQQAEGSRVGNVATWVTDVEATLGRVLLRRLRRSRRGANN